MGDGITDDTGTMQSALDFTSSASETLYIPYGTYSCLGLSLNGTDNISIVGDEELPEIIMPQSGADAGTDILSFVNTTHITGLSLSGNVVPNSTKITLIDASSLSAGMVLHITSDKLWYHDDRAIYFQGEIHEITEVNGNIVTIADYTRDFYDTGANTVTVRAWQPFTASIKNLSLVLVNTGTTAVGTIGIYLTEAINSNIENVKVNNVNFAGVMPSRCINTKIDNFRGFNVGYPQSNGYVIQDRGSLGTMMTRVESIHSRKIFDASSESGANSSICRDWQISDFTVEGGGKFYPNSVDPADVSYGVGTHGSSENGLVSDGIISNVSIGINPRGRALKVNNVKFSGTMNSCVTGTFGSGLEVTNCVADSYSYPDKGTLDPTKGIFNFLTLSNASGTGPWEYTLPVNIENNKVNGLITNFIDFAGLEVDIEGVTVRNNDITTNAVSGTPCILFRCVNQNISKSTLEYTNTIRALSGTEEPELYSAGLDIGYSTASNDSSVRLGDNSFVIMALDDTVVKIPRVTRADGSRPIINITAGSAGYGNFVMVANNATLTSLGRTTGFEGNISGSTMTGTTGTDGVTTLGLEANGDLYIENRTNGTRRYTITVV